ncbi:hypothetical protein NG798_00665 [Ancylothrix sp. C2]|uniref:hypothetical protein n=1 Tax=Ancylothrix sp. D3o TaxID=2953691 RepID=UPI0021BB799A|nr:hypothetical protein [Ancylothrix sp. D3o]MCT7948305.1 hypothetical protein [Ancylothrix sp. D3o]
MEKTVLFYECPQFIDCDALTGQSFRQCPNKNHCLATAQRRNFCTLPYVVDKEKECFKVRNFAQDHHRRELIEMGWMWAEKLPYSYSKSQAKLVVSVNITTDCYEALNAGWADAIRIPDPWESRDFDCDDDDGRYFELYRAFDDSAQNNSGITGLSIKPA